MGENVGTVGVEPRFGALRLNIFANEARKCGYVEVSFELKRRLYKYFMNFYPLFEGLNNYFLTNKAMQPRTF